MANTRNKVAIVFDGVVCCETPSQSAISTDDRPDRPWLPQQRVFFPSKNILQTC
ncbi:MAG: hypothetical protein FWH14_00455 [Oscillospiraceae bacterium]|nr:hypothetical protein [Oscillospiraceae bacterium]